MSSSSKVLWQDVIWQNAYQRFQLFLVKGNEVTTRNSIYLDHPESQEITWLKGSIWLTGDFESARSDITKLTGIQNFSWKFTTSLNHFDMKGVINAAGDEIHCMSFSRSMEKIRLLSSNDKVRLKAEREPANAPLCRYELQPEKRGKLLWFSGPPGVGKSTTAQRMARKNGYVYYEADCFGIFGNPF